MITTIPKWSKIFALGHRHTKKIWDGPVEITEKVDGSQFSFGRFDDGLLCRSKRTILCLDAPDSLFLPAVEHVKSLDTTLPKNIIYFGETLKSPKHNVLKYDRIPRNHIALFGAYDLNLDIWYRYTAIMQEADRLMVEAVPQLAHAHDAREWQDQFGIVKAQLIKDSFLGGAKIEGVVIKNYAHDFMVGDQYFPLTCAKFVSEKFKEKHDSKAYGKQAQKQGWEEYMKSFQTEARWMKAVQHLREDGKLDGSPKDIGPLIMEVKRDIQEECKDEIMEYLWKHFSPNLLRVCTHGLPEFYKEALAKGDIDADC
jgi:hypothetical protein